MARTVLRLLAAASLLASFAAGPAAAPVAAGGGCHEVDEVGHTDGSATVVRMDACAFTPMVVRVPTGTEVRFLNTASVEHMVVGESQTWGSADGLSPGSSVRQRFTEAGVFPYSCPLHPGMVGAVVVGETTAGGAAPAGAAGAAGAQGGSTTIHGAAPAAASAAGVPAGLIGAALAMTVLGLVAVGGLLLARLRPGRPVAAKER